MYYMRAFRLQAGASSGHTYCVSHHITRAARQAVSAQQLQGAVSSLLCNSSIWAPLYRGQRRNCDPFSIYAALRRATLPDVGMQEHMKVLDCGVMYE